MSTIEESAIQLLERYAYTASVYAEARSLAVRQGGLAIRLLRKEKRFGLHRFAAMIGIHYSTLSKIENSHIPLSPVLAEKIIKVVKGE